MRIAILDDDPAQLALLTAILEAPLETNEEVTCEIFSKGEQLRRILKRETFDVLILDWNVPDLDGVNLLKWLREERKDATPVLMLSSRAAEFDVADALISGADDYVVKPFRPLELRARLTRLHARSVGISEEEQWQFGDWHFDRVRNIVLYQPSPSAIGQEMQSPHVAALTEREFRLALALFRNMGKAVSRAYLINKAGYEDEDVASRTLDSHIYRLRSKLRLAGGYDLSLLTVYGKGYRLEATSPPPVSDLAPGIRTP